MTHWLPDDGAHRAATPSPARYQVPAPERFRRFRAPAAAVVLALLSPSPVEPSRAAEPAPSLSAQLAGQLGGKTLSAVAYVRIPPEVGGRLQRVVLQAYLAPDGRSVVRQWVGARNSYSAPAQTRWSLTDDLLCIGLASGPLCAKVHIWGPRIAGIGTQPYAMLDGDLQAGNAIGRAR